MDVKGFNNLSISSNVAKTTGGKSTSAKDKSSSFESILGESQTQKRSQDEKSSAPVKPAAVTPAPVQKFAKAPLNKPNFKKSAPEKMAPEPVAPEAVESESAQSENENVAVQTNFDQKAMPMGSSVSGKDSLTTKTALNEDSVSLDGETLPEVDAEQFDLAGQEALPAPGGIPNFSGPTVSERVLNAPSATQAIAPLAKQTPGGGQDEAVNSLTRRVVWNNFLRKMNDLGVSAEDVVKAFHSLSKEELALPPEKSVDTVVAALGLNDQQTQLARQYFNELIQKTQSKSLGEELSVSDKQIGLTLMSQRETQRKSLQRSLASMEKNFFSAQAPSKPLAPTVAGAAQSVTEKQDAEKVLQAGMDRAAQEASVDESALLSQSTPFAIAGLPNAQPAPTQSGRLATNPVTGASTEATEAATSELNSLLEKMKAPTGDEKKSMQEMVKNFTSKQNLNAAGNAGAIAATTANVAPAHAATAPSAAAMSALNLILSGKLDHGTVGEDAGDDGADASQYLGATALTETRANGIQQAKGEFQATLAQQATPQVMTAPELVQQAQLMVRDGGGEMKVTMHPEGMGEVAMRVSVDNGKVQVQMITESDEAKKLIERSLGELKSGLSQNNLHVESIKVDTATNLGKQLEQQYHEAQRHNAQQNMEQFRQDSQGWRRSFFDTPAVRNYPSQNQAPRDIQSSNAANAKKAGQRRLDLVA